MHFFFVVKRKSIRNGMLVLTAILLAVGVFLVNEKSIDVFTMIHPEAVYSVPTNKKEIALTFDVSWGDRRAVPIIEFLKKENVQATFFLSAPWAESHPEIVAKLNDNGFEIGNHGNKHDYYSTMEDNEVRKEIMTAHTILSKLTGKTPRLIRFPNGDFNQRTLKVASKLGYTVIQWDIDSLDWMNIGTNKIVRRVVSMSHPGDIILMHASDSSKQTLDALPQIIAQLKSQGFTFVSVTDLIEQTDVKKKQLR